MEENTKILDSVKQSLGIVPEYDAFDPQVLLYINAAFATLHQLGVGPTDGLYITSETTWSEVIDEPRLNLIKPYVCMSVQLAFAPPTSSFVLSSLKEELQKYEWRILSEVECYGE